MTTKKTPAKKAASSVAAEASTVPARKSAAKKKASSAAEPALVAPTQHDIQLLAYYLWIQRGRQHGGDAQDWLRAEHQLQNG
ncbi:DUF2934 domain-containing protein [Granulicella sibirica]|uniref:DUF2934 domain-containing protein n=1 Tax=Granulicella sibirica TaxID=2479048 RepID=UPI001008722C|nr:DUF2934 domain-containing protein [Granulicella sibirica]